LYAKLDQMVRNKEIQIELEALNMRHSVYIFCAMLIMLLVNERADAMSCQSMQSECVQMFCMTNFTTTESCDIDVTGSCKKYSCYLGCKAAYGICMKYQGETIVAGTRDETFPEVPVAPIYEQLFDDSSGRLQQDPL